MKKTNIDNHQHFEKVVDCSYACPAHTPVPEYIRLIAERRYTEAYMINWQSNVFPGILGRVCDRPCEPACRRGRLESDEDPVAICRLKRVTADYRDDISEFLPTIPNEKNGKKIALIGGGPASLSVARDLAPLGYQIVLYERDAKAGGMMRSQIPLFRLPETVLDEECDYVLDMGVDVRYGSEITSMTSLLGEEYDAIFVGTGAPKGRPMIIPGYEEAKDNIHIGIEWLANVSFKHIDSVSKRVVVLGGGNTAMDCCRTSKRIGGSEVKVVVRSSYEDMKASPWEKEDAAAEGIEIIPNHNPKEYLVEDGKLVGIVFEEVQSVYDENGRRSLVNTGETLTIPCDEVIVAIGQDTAFPWIERDIGIEFNKWDQPVLNKTSFQSTHPKIFFGGDAAFGPENIITAVAHGHQAAISIHNFCQGKGADDRDDREFALISQKMGIHEWSYQNEVSHDVRYAVPHMDWEEAVKTLAAEVELGYDEQLALKEAHRCLSCDVQTVFFDNRCIECNSCVEICPMDCINFLDNSDEQELRANLIVPAENTAQDIYVSGELKTGRVMAKDEDVCLHCGLCAERCPTGAWDMQKFDLKQEIAKL